MGKLHHWILGCNCDTGDMQQDVFLFLPFIVIRSGPLVSMLEKTLGKQKSENKVSLLFISRGDISVKDSLN